MFLICELNFTLSAPSVGDSRDTLGGKGFHKAPPVYLVQIAMIAIIACCTVICGDLQ